jgi:hypothetical protein
VGNRAMDGGGGTVPDVKAELETLTTFKNRVDEMLKDLDGSDASPKKIGEDRLQAGHLGTGFGESGKLMSTYNHVHDRLHTLSQLLADQIEAMSISVTGARDGYANVDEEQRRRLWAIYDTTDKDYDPKLDPMAPQNTGGTPPPSDGSQSSSVGSTG